MDQAGHTSLPYRSDIDGLRAIAVLSVIFFHAEFAWAKGGFVGVDVFFVISGYLITGILLRELRSESFSLKRFYERRARRILPALLVVIAATLGACALLMFAADLRVVARSAVSVLAFAANIMFWRGIDFGDITTVNYFGRRIHEQPLVHTWSLGVEEQYYLLFPVTLLLVWKIRRSLLLPVLLASTALSLALSVWLTPGSPGLAFYLLPTRGWELLAGGLIAWWGMESRTDRASLREAAAAAGLLLVLIPVVLYDSETPFPGYAAVAPVAGSALLIRYASASRIGALLSWRPLVFIGLISYSAYLWHQPLFALARYVSLSGHLGTGVAVLLSAITLVLAAITWKWIETPFRDRRSVSTPMMWWSALAATIAVAIPASLLAFGGDAGLRTPIASNIIGQSVMSLISDCSITKPTRGLGNGCVLDPSSDEPPKFLVAGDSHSEAMFPGFAKISRDTGVQGRLLQHIACSPLLEVGGMPTSTPDCVEMRERALQLVSDHQIGMVFLVSRFSFAYGPMNLFEERLARTIDAYAQRGAVVYLVSQAPEQPAFLRRNYLRAVLRQQFFGTDAEPAISAMTVTRAAHEKTQAFVRSAFAKYSVDPRVRLIDFSNALCDQSSCAAGTTREAYYVDEHHLSALGAVLVSDEIARQAGLVRGGE
ncbi:MAG TPA: acyltransferase family protein [Vicinamibacterales bacterium]